MQRKTASAPIWIAGLWPIRADRDGRRIMQARTYRDLGYLIAMWRMLRNHFAM